MKTLLSVILTAGTAYYVTSRVAITGPSDWGAVPPSAPHRNDYAISASNSPLAGVTVSGDPQFTIDGSACVGARSCVAPASLLANVGGDYVASIVGTSSSRLRVHGSSTTRSISAHVVGANYTLSGVDNGDATATFTLTSTGESDLEGVSLAASTYAGIGTATITANSCGEVVPSGKSCNVVVAFSLPKEGAAAHGCVLLQAIGNTRQQPPARTTLVLPAAAE